MQDEFYIQRCLELAKQGELGVNPNPMVGCVVVHQGEIVAEGFHQKFGEAHAEVNALAALPESIDIKNCEVYVSLEPCSHFGKTPPCADLLVHKHPKRVIVGMLDSNKQVAGRGIKKLMDAGIDVTLGVEEDACRELNKKFIKAHTTQRPFVTLKWAETKDGYMGRAAGDTSSAKISDPPNDVFVHRLRATHQAILVGAGTVNRDNPKLDVRHISGNNPIKIVLSENGTVNLDASLFSTGTTFLYDNTHASELSISLADYTIDSVLKDLYSKGIHSVLVEGGTAVLKAFLDAKAWDEAIILKAEQSWGAGVKAPHVGLKAVSHEKVNTDTIKIFKPIQH